MTESILFNDIESVQEKITLLRSHGIKLAIDDFGTGFSSFSYLRDMELDFLKIDRSFVQNINHDVRSRAIVKSIIDIGINLGYKVIAEGIESSSVMDMLTLEQCHVGQGYHFSKPVTEDMLVQYVQHHPLDKLKFNDG